MKNNPTIQASAKVIEDNFKAIFPNGYIHVGVRKSIGNPYLYVDFGLIADIKDVSNNIRQNDPLYTTLMGHDVSDVDVFTLETLQSGLMCKPKPNTHYAMSAVKTAYRKSKGDIKSYEKKLNTYFKKVAKIVIENKDNIINIEKIDPKYLQINV